MFNSQNFNDPRTKPVEVGQEFWVRVAIEDQCEVPAGFTDAALRLSWDPAVLELRSSAQRGEVPPGSPLLSPRFTRNRIVVSVNLNAGHPTSLNPHVIPSIPNLELLGATQLADAIGDAPPSSDPGGEDSLFGWLQFRALRATEDTPFTIETRAFSAVDGDPITAVAILSERQQRIDADGSPNELPQALPREDPPQQVVPSAVVEFFDVVSSPTNDAVIDGTVFTDIDRDGRFDSDTEFGIPNVLLTLRPTAGAAPSTVRTDADGRFRFVVAAGEYALEESQPTGFVDAGLRVGTVSLPATDSAGTAVGFNLVNTIRLSARGSATGYEFGENVIPTKRFLLASAQPQGEVARLTAGAASAPQSAPAVAAVAAGASLPATSANATASARAASAESDAAPAASTAPVVESRTTVAASVGVSAQTAAAARIDIGRASGPPVEPTTPSVLALGIGSGPNQAMVASGPIDGVRGEPPTDDSPADAPADAPSTAITAGLADEALVGWPAPTTSPGSYYVAKPEARAVPHGAPADFAESDTLTVIADADEYTVDTNPSQTPGEPGLEGEARPQPGTGRVGDELHGFEVVGGFQQLVQ